MLDVLHPNGAAPTKLQVRELLLKKFKVQDEKTIYLYGFQTAFGGGITTGFGLIYDTLEDALDAEPRYRLVRAGLADKKTGSRKQRKELKNRRKKVRGKAKAKVGAGGK